MKYDAKRVLRNIKPSNKVKSIILFVTDRCNHKCVTCFNWKEINQKKDIDAKKFETIAKKLPEMNSILLSGGEPLLRKDISEIIGYFVQYNKIQAAGIPTNGMLPDLIIELTEQILKDYPDLYLEISCSLDGLEETHDYIRGVKGAYKNVLRTISLLKQMRRKYSNLRIVINSVITNRNEVELQNFVNFVKTLKLDAHNFDLIRGFHQGKLSLPKNLSMANKIRFETQKYYSKPKNPIHGFLSTLFYKWIIVNQGYSLKKRAWDVDCVAGTNTIVILSDGTVAVCELLEPVGNLLENDLDEILNSDKVLKQKKGIKCHKCDCTHICFVQDSLSNNMITFFKKIPALISKRI